MKNLMMILWAAILISCNQEKTPSLTSTTSEPAVNNYQDTISEQTFLAWTSNWSSFGLAYCDTAMVKYYDMPVIDLAEVLGEQPAGARFYNGLEDLGNQKYIAHLILAATDQDGKDKGPYFDITQPCPPLCGPK